jgi:hypothetical protein
MDKNQEELKSNGSEVTVIEGLEKRTNEAGESLIKAGEKFLASIIVTILTIIINLLILTSDSPDTSLSVGFSVIGSLISFILLILAIKEIKSAGKSLKSTK